MLSGLWSAMSINNIDDVEPGRHYAGTTAPCAAGRRSSTPRPQQGAQQPWSAPSDENRSTSSSRHSQTWTARRLPGRSTRLQLCSAYRGKDCATGSVCHAGDQARASDAQDLIYAVRRPQRPRTTAVLRERAGRAALASVATKSRCVRWCLSLSHSHPVRHGICSYP